MPAFFRSVPALEWRGPFLWLLIVALAIYGCSATLVQTVGTAHRHERPLGVKSSDVFVALDGMFRDVRTWRAALHERWLPGDGSHVHGAAGHSQTAASGHDHTALKRHHHDRADPTVVSIDGAAGDAAVDALAAQASAGSASLPLGMAPRIALPAPAAVVVSWIPGEPGRWTDAPRALAERPPRG